EPPMRAADQWARIEEGLPSDWTEARLAFTPEGPMGDAAAVLGPLQPGRIGGDLRFGVARGGGGAGRARQRFPPPGRKRSWGALEVVDLVEAAPVAETPATAPVLTQTLVEQWDATIADLPPGWSDLLCELELESSDHLPRAALLGAPLNPTRNTAAIALRFRV